MELKLYNTLTKKKQVFKPIKKGRVSQYDCGPTTYFHAHIGNMWRYIVSDLLRRTLEYNGYKVKQAMNITDVGHLTEDDLLAADTGEDKMIVRAKKEKKTPEQIAEFYTKSFFKDTQRLNILRPHVIPKATDHIKEMIKMIKKLEKKGFAYQANKKYFVYDISKFKEYGKLSGKKTDELQTGARLEPVPGKKNPFDFALWVTDPKHLMKWNSPWGQGYPGWHIECSAMSKKHLGDTIDIHTGGEDNIFPHHENEIAQSEASNEKPFVNYWVHVRHNLVDGKKMSKSKGTSYLLQDLINKGYDPLSYRYLCLMTHYRSNLNFTWKSLKAADIALSKLRQAIRGFDKGKTKNSEIINKYREKFFKAINDDLNLPKALALTWNLIKDDEISSQEKRELILDFDKVFGLGLDKIEELKIPQQVKELVEQREEYRKEKDFEKSDKTRKEIEKLGFVIKDTDQGPQILKK